MNEKLHGAAKASAANARRLLDEAEMLQLEKPPTTSLYISLLAQEEYAKAFLLLLAAMEVIPWDRHLLRATRDHTCKQLLGIVLDHMSLDTEGFLERLARLRDGSQPLDLPARVADAMNILRHEKIRRWESKTWVWVEDPEYDPEVLRIAEGKKDASKQDALYVRVGRDGSVASVPDASAEIATAEYKRGRRFGQTVEELIESGRTSSVDWPPVREILRLLFANEDPLDSEEGLRDHGSA